MTAPVVKSLKANTLYFVGAAVITLLLIELVGTLGNTTPDYVRGSAAAIVLYRTLIGAAAMLLWLAPALLLASLATPFLKLSPARFPIRVALGLALGFTLTHLLACAGAFSAGARTITLALWCLAAFVASIIGFRRLLAEHKGPSSEPYRFPLYYCLALPAIAVMLVAASQPPGWLWGSEFGGFDALSYHLQLPQEWLAAGRLAPVNHNVYSYLPSYVESVFMQFAAAAECLNSVPPVPADRGLLALEGLPLLVCQHFHLWCAIIGAWLTGRCVSSLTGAAAPAGLSFTALLSVPWIVVTGSLAYNDCAALALFAGAMLIAAESSIAASIRSVLAAFVIGVACGCKPTALLFCVVPVALLLLRDVPFRSYPKLFAIAAFTGLFSLSPWLIRNMLATGNPVFPQLHTFFGDSHWSTEQFARYKSAHTFAGSLGDRISLLFSSDRGLLHPQFAFSWIALVLLIFVALSRTNRKLGMLLALGIASQIAAWLFATHLQSRFLMPLTVPLAIAVGICFHAAQSRRLVAICFAILLCAHAASSISLYSQQRPLPPLGRGDPNRFLFTGPDYFSGELFRRELAGMKEPDRTRYINEALDPAAFLRVMNIDPRSVLLVGDATPLYFGPVQYATTWDNNPLIIVGDVSTQPIYRSPAQLRGQGTYYLLVNFAELERYRSSHWIDTRLMPDLLTGWLKENAVALKPWKDRGVVLFELKEPAPVLLGPPG